MMNRYKIAGLLVDMDVSGRTYEQAQPYRSEETGPADITLTLDKAEVLRRNPDLGDEDNAEYCATSFLFARQVLNFEGYYLHSSAVILDGKAYLFSADSGTGKSTHTKKWCRLFGAHYLNDDKPILRYENGTWMAYGTPWSGKDNLSSNEGVPLGGITCLYRGQENTIVPMAATEAVPFLLGQTVIRLTQEQMIQKLDLLDRLLRQVPVWKLHCRDDDEAAFVSRKAMTGEGSR